MDWRKLERWLTESNIGKWLPTAPLSMYTSWRIGGPARVIAWPTDEAGCAELLRYCSREGFPVRFLGLGTNLLAADEGIEALVIHTGELKGMEWGEYRGEDGQDAGKRLLVGAGVSLSRIAIEAAELGLSGLEFAAGIPGSFGGALMMNAGAYGGQISDLVEHIRVMDEYGAIQKFARDELVFGYRDGALRTSRFLIVSGGLRFGYGDRAGILAAMEGYLHSRKESQPLDMPSGGSVFRNPAGGGAGRYIDQAGLKGLREGNAQISVKHANFIINLGGARAEDVRVLMDKAEKEVRKRYGIVLEREIIYWE